MAKPKHFPRNAVVVEDYRELNSFTKAFAAGHLRFLMVVGPARYWKKSGHAYCAWMVGLLGSMEMRLRSACIAQRFCIRISRLFSMMSMLSTGTLMEFGCSSSYASLNPRVRWVGTPTLNAWSDEGSRRSSRHLVQWRSLPIGGRQ